MVCLVESVPPIRPAARLQQSETLGDLPLEAELLRRPNGDAPTLDRRLTGPGAPKRAGGSNSTVTRHGQEPDQTAADDAEEVAEKADADAAVEATLDHLSSGRRVARSRRLTPNAAAWTQRSPMAESSPRSPTG